MRTHAHHRAGRPPVAGCSLTAAAPAVDRCRRHDCVGDDGPRGRSRRRGRRRLRHRADQPRHHQPGRSRPRSTAPRQRLRDAREVDAGGRDLARARRAGDLRGPPDVHADAAGRRHVPRRRSADGERRGVDARAATRAPSRPPDSPSVESVEATDDATVVITLTEPDNDLAFHLSQRAGAVLNEGATESREQRQRHRPVRPRRVEPRLVDHARAQRRLLGRAGDDRRDHVPVLHRPERRRQRPARRRHRPPRAGSTPTSSSSSRTTPTSSSPTGRPTASSPSA